MDARRATGKRETITITEGGVTFKVERVIPEKAAVYMKEVAASEKKSIAFLKRIGYLTERGNIAKAYR